MTSLTFFRKLLPVFSLLLVLLFLTGAPAEEPLSEPGLTTDMIETDAHQAITWDLIHLVEHSPSLKSLLEQAISQAHALNPDPMTNPVHYLCDTALCEIRQRFLLCHRFTPAQTVLCFLR